MKKPAEDANRWIENDEPLEDRRYEDHWSPPQFSLSWILRLTFLFALLFAVIRAIGPDVIFPAITIFFVYRFFLGCFRLVRLSKQPDD